MGCHKDGVYKYKKNHCWRVLLPTIAKLRSFSCGSPKYFSLVCSYSRMMYGLVMPILKSMGLVMGLWACLDEGCPPSVL